MPWENQSRRRDQLPRNWPQLRQACGDRAGWQCEATTQQGTRCPHPGNEAHHPTPNDHTHLILLCPFHHQIETQKQARAARTYVTQARPKETHPGLKPHPTQPTTPNTNDLNQYGTTDLPNF